MNIAIYFAIGVALSLALAVFYAFYKKNGEYVDEVDLIPNDENIDFMPVKDKLPLGTCMFLVMLLWPLAIGLVVAGTLFCLMIGSMKDIFDD